MNDASVGYDPQYNLYDVYDNEDNRRVGLEWKRGMEKRYLISTLVLVE